MERVAAYQWKYHNGPKPETVVVSGVVQVGPQLVLKHSQNVWTCLVSRDADGKVLEKDPKDLYVFTREISL